MKILIKREFFHGKEKYDRVTGLTDFVNLLFENYFYQHEIPKEALKSYYVDYYNQEVIHGGIAQFVYNSKWESEVVNYILNGLRNMSRIFCLSLLYIRLSFFHLLTFPLISSNISSYEKKEG